MTDFKWKNYSQNNNFFPCFQVDTIQRRIDDAFVVVCVKRKKLDLHLPLTVINRILASVIFQGLVNDKCLWSILTLSEGIRKANEIIQS